MEKSNLFIALKGMAMGMAEVVPGVSGGTIAFITNIYERLIQAIKRISGVPVKIIKEEGFRSFWVYIDGAFLTYLAIGMVFGILAGVLGISYLLEHYPSIIWGFFFGLIIGSAIYIGTQIKQWGPVQIISLLAGIAFAYYITIISPTHGSSNLGFVFLSGMIAVCALILPGISGSFILLLMGMYTIILHSAKQAISEMEMASIILLVVFILGCIIGLALFSNLLNFLFKRFHNTTLAVLTGFMIGSLNRIWPWRNPALWLDEKTGDQLLVLPPGANIEDFKVIRELNVLPANFEGTPFIFGVILCFFLGLALVWVLDRTSKE